MNPVNAPGGDILVISPVVEICVSKDEVSPEGKDHVTRAKKHLKKNSGLTHLLHWPWHSELL